MTSIENILSQAVAHHQAGRSAEAEGLYRQVLLLQPWDFNALHLLGLILVRSAAPQDGATLMRRALDCNPQLEAAYINLSNFLRMQDRLEEAILCVEQGVKWLPDAAKLREILCMQCHDWAVQGLDGGDKAVVAARVRLCLKHLLDAPVITQGLYTLLEPEIRVALMAGDDEAAAIYVRLRNRHDFAAVPADDIDVFSLDLSDFSQWCERIGAPARFWRAPAQTPTAATLADYPDYLHVHVNALPELAAAPLGVALETPVEVVQGFYVKDNYENFVISDRRAMLCENKLAVVRGARIPLIGVTPNAERAAFRLPKPLYRTLEIDEPVIFLPSTPNYWHFMVEVLPMLMVRDMVPETRDLPILQFDTRGYQYEMLDLIGAPRGQVRDVRQELGPDVKEVVYRLRRAVIPSQVSYPVAYRWLRDHLLTKIRPDRPAYPKRVFLSRRSAYPKHRIANDGEVGDLLVRYGFTVVLPETLSVLETIEMIAGAEMVVAPIGAGTSNHVFLPPHGAWIHLNSPDFFCPESIWNRQMGTQATLIGHFRHLTGRFIGDPATFPTRDVDRLEIPIEIDLNQLERLIQGEEARLARG